MTALILAWRFEGGRSQVHDFATSGEMSVLCREIASHLDIVDGGKAFYEGVIGDLEGECMRLRAEKRELEKQIDFWLIDRSEPLREAARA